MADQANHWKIGLFVLTAVGAGVLGLVGLGAGFFADEPIDYLCSFDESVDGLEVGSPARFRGVTVGSVGKVNIAADRHHVLVQLAIRPEGLEHAHLVADGKPLNLKQLGVSAQLSQMGMAGNKFINLDYAMDAADTYLDPAIANALNALPTTPSTLRRLELSLLESSRELPKMLQAGRSLLVSAGATLEQMNGIVSEIHAQALGRELGATLQEARTAFRVVSTEAKNINAKQISADFRTTLKAVTTVASDTDQIAARLNAPDGLLANAEQLTGSADNFVRAASRLEPDLGSALRDVSGAARSVRRLSDALDRDPDMLLKGK